MNNLLRFEDKFIPVTETGCWVWVAGCDKDGYGQFSMNGIGVRAHRASYMFYSGSIPDGMCVLHKCDNPSCVNPDHLYVGTNQDNVNDRVYRGRQAYVKGEDHGGSKLNNIAVKVIRYLGENGVSVKRLSEAYGIGSPNISMIISGKIWKHV